jgi:hypothetical protein
MNSARVIEEAGVMTMMTASTSEAVQLILRGLLLFLLEKNRPSGFLSRLTHF